MDKFSTSMIVILCLLLVLAVVFASQTIIWSQPCALQGYNYVLTTVDLHGLHNYCVRNNSFGATELLPVEKLP